MSNSRNVTLVLVLFLVAGVVTNPVRRSPDLEARRRSAIDRSLIRFGRSYGAEPSAGDLREAFERPTRKGNSFLRFGKSQPFTIAEDDLITFLKTYDDDYENSMAKRVSNFVRLGRDPKFIRLGRSLDDEKEQTPDIVISGYPQRKHRARDHFIRLGRDREEINGNDTEEVLDDRKKRSTETCHDCHS